MQSKSRDEESNNIFSSTKTRIEQLEINIAKVMEERSHDARLATAIMSQKRSSKVAMIRALSA